MLFKKFFKKAEISNLPACYQTPPIFLKDTGSGKLFTDPCDPSGMFIQSQNEARVIEFFRKAGISVNRKEIGYIYRFGDHTNSLKSDMSVVANVLEINPENPQQPLIVRPKILIPFEVWGKNLDQATHRDLTKEALYREQSSRSFGSTTAAQLLHMIKLSAGMGENLTYGFKRALKEVLGTYLFRKVGATIISIEGKRIAPNYLSDVLNQSLILYTPPAGLQLFEGKQTTRPVLAQELIQKYNIEVQELTQTEAENIFNNFTGQFEEALKYGGKHIDALIDRGELDQIYNLVTLVDEDNKLNQLAAQQLLMGESAQETLKQITDIRNQISPLTSQEAIGVFFQDVAGEKEVSPSLIRILAAADTLEGGLETKDKFFKDINKFMETQLSKMLPEARSWLQTIPEFQQIQGSYNRVLNDISQFEAVLDLVEDLEDKQSKILLDKLNDSLIDLFRKISEFKKNNFPRLFMDKIINEQGFIPTKTLLYKSLGSEGDVDNFLSANPAYLEKIGKKNKPSLINQPQLNEDPIIEQNTIPGKIDIGMPLPNPPEHLLNPQLVTSNNKVYFNNPTLNLTKEAPKESTFKGFKRNK